MDRDPRQLIPHRPPALCIDEVIAVGSSSAHARRTIPASATIDDQLWQPWLIEGLAQTAAVLHAYLHDPDGEPHEGLLVGVRHFQFHARPRLGETLDFQVEVIKRITPLTLIQGEARIGNRLVAAGQLKFFVSTTGEGGR